MPVAQRKRKAKATNEPDHKEQEVKKNNTKSVTSQSFRPVSVFVGFLLIFYITFYYNKHFTEFGHFGSFHNILYLSNFCLLIAAVAMISQNPSLIALAIACASFSHISWLYDIFLWNFSNTQAFNRVTYLSDTLTPSIQLLWPTTLHHLWFLPLCFCVLHFDYRMVGIHVNVWVQMCAINIVMSTISYFGFGNIHDENLPDFNTGHEFWLISHAQSLAPLQHSSPLPELLVQHHTNLIHKYDTSPFLIFLIWTFLVQSVLLNGTCFLLLKVLSVLFLEDPVKVVTQSIDYFFGQNASSSNTVGSTSNKKPVHKTKAEHQN